MKPCQHPVRNIRPQPMQTFSTITAPTETEPAPHDETRKKALQQ